MNGMVIIEMISLIDAADIADYTLYKTQLKQTRDGSTSFGLAEAIRESADINDTRYKFY